jgi:hypothetical protein
MGQDNRRRLTFHGGRDLFSRDNAIEGTRYQAGLLGSPRAGGRLFKRRGIPSGLLHVFTQESRKLYRRFRNRANQSLKIIQNFAEKSLEIKEKSLIIVSNEC